MERRPAGDHSVPAASPTPQAYSVAQVARLFGMSEMTVYRAISSGEFPAIRIRSRLIVPAVAVEAMIAAALSERTAVDATGEASEAPLAATKGAEDSTRWPPTRAMLR
jgi:excisionase family DNA binding protein